MKDDNDGRENGAERTGLDLDAMGYVIKVMHRSGTPPMYVGTVPVPTRHDSGYKDLSTKGFQVVDSENTAFDSFEEASKFPFPTADIAAEVVFSFPETKNIIYEVVVALESPAPPAD
jgi:hypothetical protein